MKNALYQLMLSNIKQHISGNTEDKFNIFTLTSVLAILVNKTKEDVMNDYLNNLK